MAIVILRCSPSSASLEGWAKSAEPSFETPRKRAAPQDDGILVDGHAIARAFARSMALPTLRP
jgi:hypothetical protein